MTDLNGKHVVITGGNRGIGSAIAAALADAGATITVMARDMTVETPYTKIQCDVTDEASVSRAFAAAFEQHGKPFALVNNAGQADGAKLEDTTLELWNRLIAVNLTGTFLCTKQVVSAMTDAGAGRIINIAS